MGWDMSFPKPPPARHDLHVANLKPPPAAEGPGKNPLLQRVQLRTYMQAVNVPVEEVARRLGLDIG